MNNIVTSGVMLAKTGKIASMASDEKISWRVFVSHTAELRKYPTNGSYIDAAERAICGAGHVVVNMADFPSTNAPPADECIRRVQSCDIYIGILGTRYGSPVRNQPEISYTELEYNTATDVAIPRLMFLLDTNAENLGIPLRELIDRQYGDRQDVFRAGIKNTARRFSNPGDLKYLVAHSLQEELTRQRINKAIQDEKKPDTNVSIRPSKFINHPPMTAPTWFRDRVVETRLVATWLTDPSIRMVTVMGRGGIGKTAMICRLLKNLENGVISNEKGKLNTIGVGGIIYLSPTGNHRVTYANLISDLCQLLPEETTRMVKAHYQDPQTSISYLVLTILEALPSSHGPIVVLLDNLESVMDAERQVLSEESLQIALETVLKAPEHPLTILITTRIPPTKLLQLGPESCQLLRIDKGLDAIDARTVLKDLDSDGNLGLKNAPNHLLDEIQEHTRGFPRALVAIKSVLFSNPTFTPAKLLDQIRDLPENDVIDALVGQAYRALDKQAQQVMQALAVYPTPVAAVGVDFLLQPYDPTVNTSPVLGRLVQAQLVRYEDAQYSLHPVDRDYVCERIPRSSAKQLEPNYTIAKLQARAADYYAQIRTPRRMWKSIDDIQPQLAEFHLRYAYGDYNLAARVLADIDFDYLRVWGHYRTLIFLHEKLRGRLTDPSLQLNHLSRLGGFYYAVGEYRQAINLHEEALRISLKLMDHHFEVTSRIWLGLCHYALGNFHKAINLYEEALPLTRTTKNQSAEAATFRNLGNCHHMLGNYPTALTMHEDALKIDQQIEDSEAEASDMGNLANCHYASGNYSKAEALYEQVLVLADRAKHQEVRAATLGNLANVHYARGNYPKAISLHEDALLIQREIEDRQGEANELGNLGLCQYAVGNFTQAIELHKKALDIHREIEDRQGEVNQEGNLGNSYSALGNYSAATEYLESALSKARQLGVLYQEAAALVRLSQVQLRTGNGDLAVSPLTQAVTISDTTGNFQISVMARLGLAAVHLAMGQPSLALPLAGKARRLNYPSEQARACLMQGVSLLALGQAQEARRAFLEAISVADTLITLCPLNVTALYSRALASCGMVVVDDNTSMEETELTWHEASEAITANGIANDFKILFNILLDCDYIGVLALFRNSFYVD